MRNLKLLTWQWFVGVHSGLPKLLNDVIAVFTAFPLFGKDDDPRHIYRSILPFLPPSSPILVHYSKLSDPIRVLRVRSRKTTKNEFHVFRRGSSPISPVACTALSDDGHRVALGFDNGVVEVVDIELGTTISRSAGLQQPPVWLLFIRGGHKLVIETSKGDIYILDIFTLRRQRLSSRIDGSTMVVASLSHDGSMIVRAAQHLTTEWYENVYIIHIATDSPTIHSLSTSSHIIPYPGTGPRFPLQRSVGFSPDGQYVAAFDTKRAFVWSCTSFQLIAHYSIEDPLNWFLNTNRPSAVSTLALPNDVIITPFPEHSESISSTSCILFTLGSRRSADPHRIGMHAISLAAAAAPVLDSQNIVWFRGHKITIIPHDYCISRWHSIGLRDRVAPEAPANLSLPTSQDGTRFLLYDNENCPVVVDISEAQGFQRLEHPVFLPAPAAFCFPRSSSSREVIMAVTQNAPRLIVSFDFGTTKTTVAVAYLAPGTFNSLPRWHSLHKSPSRPDPFRIRR